MQAFERARAALYHQKTNTTNNLKVPHPNRPTKRRQGTSHRQLNSNRNTRLFMPSKKGKLNRKQRNKRPRRLSTRNRPPNLLHYNRTPTSKRPIQQRPTQDNPHPYRQRQHFPRPTKANRPNTKKTTSKNEEV